MEEPVENRIPFFFKWKYFPKLRSFVLLVRANCRWWVRASVIWCWQGNPKYSVKKTVPVSFCPTINLKQNWDRSWTSTLRSRRLTAWAMTQAISRRSLTAQAGVRFQFSLDQAFKQLLLSRHIGNSRREDALGCSPTKWLSSVSSSWFAFNRRQLSKGLEGAHHHVTTQLRTIK